MECFDRTGDTENRARKTGMWVNAEGDSGASQNLHFHRYCDGVSLAIMQIVDDLNPSRMLHTVLPAVKVSSVR